MSDNPYAASELVSDEVQPQPRSRFSWIELLVVISIIAILIGLLLPAKRSARGPARRMSCANNLKQIALALQNYEATYGTLPPACTVDDQGRPLHSWRTLILPFIEQTSLYESIDLSKPWDDPANAAARQATPNTYRCPSVIDTPGTHTTYMAVVGDDACLLPTRGRPFADITGGLSNTLMVVEVCVDHAVHWMAPDDVAPSRVREMMFGGPTAHYRGAQAALADGSVQFVAENVNEEAFAALASISDVPPPVDSDAL